MPKERVLRRHNQFEAYWHEREGVKNFYFSGRCLYHDTPQQNIREGSLPNRPLDILDTQRSVPTALSGAT
jgi:hypothetical protein